MTRIVEAVIRGEVVPFVRVCSERRTDRAQRYHGWKAGVALELAAVCPRPQPVFPDGEVAVSIAFYRWRKAGDLDNCAKGLLDSAKGILWRDDVQVTELHVIRVQCAKGEDEARMSVQQVQPVAARRTATLPPDALARVGEGVG